MAKKVVKKAVKRKTNAKTKPVIYTADVVLHHVQRLHDKLLADESICYIKGLFRGERIYCDLWSYFKRRYKGNTKIVRAIKAVEDELEDRVVSRMLSGRYSATGSIFLLKNKYRWIDKVVNQAEQEKDDKGQAVPLEIVIRGHKEVNDGTE